MLAGQAAEGGGVRARAGRRLGVNEGQDLGRGGLERFLDHGRIHRLAPFELEFNDLGAGPVGHVGHAAAEGAVDGDDGAVARLQQVHDRRFHAGGAGRGQRDAGVVGGVEQPGQRALDLFHQILELRVQVADGRAGERGQHAGADVGGAGPHQDAPRRLEALHDWSPSLLVAGTLRGSGRRCQPRETQQVSSQLERSERPGPIRAAVEASWRSRRPIFGHPVFMGPGVRPLTETGMTLERWRQPRMRASILSRRAASTPRTSAR